MRMPGVRRIWSTARRVLRRSIEQEGTETTEGARSVSSLSLHVSSIPQASGMIDETIGAAFDVHPKQRTGTA